jgi:type I restriction enzyme M protein
MDRDLLFVERCVRALNEGSKLGIVLPHRVLCNSNTRFVRDWLFENTRILGVVGIHPFIFLPHTGTKTSVLLVERTSVPQGADYPIFFAVSERRR